MAAQTDTTDTTFVAATNIAKSLKTLIHKKALKSEIADDLKALTAEGSPHSWPFLLAIVNSELKAARDRDNADRADKLARTARAIRRLARKAAAA